MKIYIVYQIQPCQFLILVLYSPVCAWRKLINTDFSAIIRTHPRHNSKNNVVYCREKGDIRDKLANPEQKFSPGVMLWGGISAVGLVPQDAPLFVDEIVGQFEKDGKPVKNINNIIYADMIESEVLPAVEELFPDLDCLFQDDEAVIHRTQHVLETVSRCFPHRIPPGMASHTADLLPIENIWAIIKMNVPKHGPFQSLKQLKTAIRKIWREIDADKPLLQRMMKSCCERCKACIRLEGDQVHKEDYSGF